MIGPLAALAFIVVQSNQPFSLKRSSCEFVTVCNVECVMSYRGRVSIGFAARSVAALERKYGATPEDRLEELRAPYEPPAKPELSVGEKLALLKLCQTQASRHIYSALIATGAAHPDRRFFAPLIDYGYARKNDADRFHSITSSGRHEASIMMRELSSRLNVHIYSERDSNWQTGGHCCCGWSSYVQKGHYSSSNLQRHFERHVATANGMAGLAKALKPPTQT